jgi:hypothetical protein
VTALCLSVVLFDFKDAGAQERISREFQIKAVFLYNFTEFVTWPGEVFDSVDSPMVIGILGNDPFGPFLDETVQGESRDGHKLVVERYQSPEHIKDCHVLFISVDTQEKLDSALSVVKDRPILTVSDMDGFTRAGGMIRFHNEDGRVRLHINAGPVSQSGLVISSKLLRQAEVVQDENN